ncbi:NAD-dependent DNA ligase LigA [Peredibacter starrii]|uniref:DNA ligase n=1 Tax=Peredibacter starrii TaxID=28202 RepID=A0AAX4HPZ8_9BACT|nr:NAD-dependent DNA ligase LigA [Peredibacter starrii]WPU65377.1 NAD-dependent DNA ligase LigA [Peredibacter starrii]
MKTARIQELEKLILHHKELYYTGHAEISDEKYDKLESELKSLDPENPVLQLVGFKQAESTAKVEHQRKMLSLDKTYDETDLAKWIGKHEVVSVFKIDGSSCSLIYENGHLVTAKTRGDGQFGENITKKAVFIPDIPKHVGNKGRFEVRGEVYCIEKNFFTLSKEMQDMGLEAPTSQRNIVAGLLGRKENIQLCRHLSFQAFDIIDDEVFSKEHQKLDSLKGLGFITPDYEIHKSGKDLKERIAEAKTFMSSGDYLIDGLVVVYDDLKLHAELGETSHHPRYKIAFKFAGETKVAKINEIEWGVSRNGTLTPVALIEPTELSGAMIGRVTLHNFGMVQNFQLKAGDKIEIIRSGEVIPKFLGVVERSNGEYTHPTNCPSCASKLVIQDIWLQCENDICPAKIKEEILNYIFKANIEDVSDKRLDEMINKGIVAGIPDLYRLKHDDFLLLDKVKDKLATKMFDNIQKTKHQSLAQFISAIGVEGVSIAKSEKIIAQGYNTLEKIQDLTVDKMLQIEGFAEKSSESILASLRKKRPLIDELLSVGVVVKADETSSGEGPLKGLSFCLTGALSQPRPQIEKLIKQNGGIIAGVSKNLSYLVTNDEDSTSSKYVKATSLKVPIIKEDQLMKMLEG